MEIPVEDAPPVEDASATESDPEWGDFKQEHGKINQFESSKLTQCCSESYSSKTEGLGKSE